VFAGGMKMSVTSNGVLSVGLGTNTSPLVTAGTFGSYETPQSIYYADGFTTKKSGTTFSVQDWIPDNLLSLRFEMWNHFQTQTRGLLDGSGYWFSDQNGVLTDRLVGFQYLSGYQNMTMGGNSYYYYCIADANPPDFQWSLSGMLKGTNTFTMATWGKPNPLHSHYGGIFSVGSWGDNTGIIFGYNVAKTVALRLGGDGLSIGSFPDSTWTDGNKHLFVLMYDGTALKILLDNSVFYSTNVVLNITGTTFDVVYGAYAGGAIDGFFRGYYLWNRALSTNELSDVYSFGPDYTPATTNTAPWNSYLAYGWPITSNDTANISDIGPNAKTLTYDGNMFRSNITYVGSATQYGKLEVTNSLLSFVPSSSFLSATINVGANTIAPSNVVLSASRDGGTSWTDSTLVTLADSWDFSNKLVTATLSLTNQPTGSNLVAKITLTNGCPIVTVKGIAAPCGE
jgi:hypothetical protein